MKYTINLNKISCYQLFEKATNTAYKVNFFEDLRRIFRDEVSMLMSEAGMKLIPSIDYEYSGKLNKVNAYESAPIKSLYAENEFLGTEFCAGYGASSYSIGAINYQHGNKKNVPSIDTFKRCVNFSIGNFIFFVHNADDQIEIIAGQESKIVGYSFDIAKRKRKSYVCLFGVHFSQEALKPIFGQFLKEMPEPELDEIKFDYASFPILFACRRTGKLYTCKCFKGHINWETEFFRSTSFGYEPDMKARINRIEYKKAICHICTGNVPRFEYGSSMYYSSFLQKYLPYYMLENKKRFGSIYHLQKEDNKEVENLVRVQCKHPKIGEKWISETMLFQLIKEIFSEHEVIFHYRGSELHGLEIDIFIPSLKLGFEYQGKQHYEAIAHWGGTDGLVKRMENDKRKKAYCEAAGYSLIEFHYQEPINKESIIKKVLPHIAL